MTMNQNQNNIKIETENKNTNSGKHKSGKTRKILPVNPTFDFGFTSNLINIWKY